MTNKIIKNYCTDCRRSTNHNVLAEKLESNHEDYRLDFEFQIVECLGCNTKSFRKVVYDIEASYPGFGDEWIVPEEVITYPKMVEGHKEVASFWELPEIVQAIYSEVLSALKENSKILAGLGLRAAVEAVCNDLAITGRSLEVRINKLASNGYISKNDAERLHGIRFMGNDAAHEIKPPKDISLSVALQIVEHLISSVYLLDSKANGNIDTTVSKFDVFERLLVDALTGFKSGDEFPIAKFLGQDMRRVKESLATLEQELIIKINAGNFLRLSVGKVDFFQGSKDKVQHYVVA